MAQQIQWGTITLILDNEAFRHGFITARRWFFEDIYGEDGRRPEEPQRATSLTSEEVLRLVVMPDEQGRYHFDQMGERTCQNTWAIWWATWVGRLLPRKRSITAKSRPSKNIFVAAYQHSMMRDGKPSRKGPEHAADHHRQTQAHHHT